MEVYLVSSSAARATILDQNRYLWNSDRYMAVWDGRPFCDYLNYSAFVNDGLFANNSLIESRRGEPFLEATTTIKHADEVLAGYGSPYWEHFFRLEGMDDADDFVAECRRFYAAAAVSPPRDRASLYSLRGLQTLISAYQENLIPAEVVCMESTLSAPSSYIAPFAVSWAYDNASSISITPQLSGCLISHFT